MRKLLLSLVAMFAMAGLVIAAQGVVTKVDGKKVTIKEGEKEKVYNVNDSTKYTVTVKGESKDSTLTALEKASKRKNKAGDVVGVKVEFTADGETLKTVSWKGGGKKKKN